MLLRRTLLVNGISTGLSGLVALVTAPALAAGVLLFAVLEFRGIALLKSAA